MRCDSEEVERKKKYKNYQDRKKKRQKELYNKIRQ